MDALTVSLISLLNGIIAECQAIIRRLEKGQSPGLGGQLQNVWEVFHLLGQLERKE